MNDFVRITVPLRLHEFERLRDIANAERRHTREQAAYMLSALLGEHSEGMNKPVAKSTYQAELANGFAISQPV